VETGQKSGLLGRAAQAAVEDGKRHQL
jgi:hypothetical protein